MEGYTGPTATGSRPARTRTRSRVPVLVVDDRVEQDPAAVIVHHFVHDRAGEIPIRHPSSDAEGITAARKRAGIGKNITPHVFRHTFGT